MGELRTERLVVRPIEQRDAEFILALLNDPDFLRNVGDRGVHNLEHARVYISTRTPGNFTNPLLGVYVAQEVASGDAMGIITLFKRDHLKDVDLGFAFLPPFRARGFAREAAAAMIEHVRAQGVLGRLAAIVQPQNLPSVRLLQRLGFVQEGTIAETDGDVSLFARPV